MNAKYEKLIELFKDSESADKLIAMSAEEASVFLKEKYQLDFSVDELKDVASGAVKALEDDSDELSEEQLTSVAGGASKGAAYTAGYYLGKAVKAVGGVAKAIGAFASSW